MSFWQNKPPALTQVIYKAPTDHWSPRVEGVTGTLYTSFSSLVKGTAWIGDVQWVPIIVQRSLLTVHVPSSSSRVQHTASLASSEGALEIMAQHDTRVLRRF